MKRTKKLFILGSLMLSALTFTACSEDEDGAENGVTVVGTWEGSVGYSCNGRDPHRSEEGIVHLGADGTGYTWMEGEETVYFNYKVDYASRCISADGEKMYWEELTGNRLVFTETCENCGRKAVMAMTRVE